MNNRRSIGKALLLLVTIIFPLKVNGANIKIDPADVSVAPGETKTFKVSCSDCAGTTKVSISDSSVAEITSIGNNGFIDKNGFEVTIVGKEEGNASINVTPSDVADSTYKKVTETKNFSINVVNNITNNTTNNTENNITNNETNNNNGDNKGDNGGNSGNGNNNNNDKKSSNNNLNTLNVKGCKLSPAFKSSITSYTCSDTYDDFVSISASASDASAKISGLGKKSLKLGSNPLSVVVTAGDGSKKTYTIRVNRKENNVGDNTLSSLVVEGYPIDFNKDKTEYFLEVPKDVDSVFVNAKPTNDNAKVTGTGKINLVNGENKIVITVEAPNGDAKTYTINCTKSDKDNIPNASLSDLKINGNDIDLSGDPKNISLSLPEFADSINLDYQTPSKTAKVEVSGADNLKEGINKVTIKVSDEGLEDKVYTLYVYNPPRDAKVVDNLDDIKEFDKDIVYNSNIDDEHILPDNIIDLLKTSDKKLIYNVMDDNGGLLFSLELDKNSELEKGINFEFIKVGENPLKYISNIPKGIKITAFVYGLFEDGTKLKLYKYDEEKNKYILLEDDIEVVNGYIKFASNGNSEYIFSDVDLNAEKTSVLGLIIRIVCLILLLLIILIIILLVIKKIRRRLRRKKLLQRKREEQQKKMNINQDR